MENFFIDFLPPWALTGTQPAFYDKESGTIIQQSARMYDKINELIAKNNELSKSFKDLYDDVHYYFDNLDVQNEINNKIDAMVESGELAQILNEQLLASINEAVQANTTAITTLQNKQAQDDINFSNINNTLILNSSNIDELEQAQAGNVQKHEADSVSMDMLDNEVRSALTGGSTPIVGSNSVGTSELKNNSVNIYKLDEKLKGLYSINYTQIDKGLPSAGFYQIYDGDVTYTNQDDNLQCYAINLEKGKIYRFVGYNYSAVNGIIIGTAVGEDAIAYSPNGTALNADGMAVNANTYSTELVFQCTQDNLKAYITEFQLAPSNTYIPTLQNYLCSLMTINSIEVFSKELPRTEMSIMLPFKTIEDYVVQCAGTNDVYALRNISGWNTECYRLQKGHKYYVSGTQQYAVGGFLLFDEKGKMVYRSLTESSNSVQTYEYEFTATGDYFAIINKGTNITGTLKEYVISLDQNNKLTGKHILYNGDSITESRTNEESTSYNGGAFPALIADATSSTYTNYAHGGATLATGNSSYYRIVDHITDMSSTCDAVVLSGGINDYWQNIPLGTYDEDDFTTAVNTSTVCGALESIFRQAINKWCGKPIIFVITHKILNTAFNNNTAGYSFKDLHDKMVGICNKYSIPYYDCFEDGGLNAYMDIMNTTYLTAGSSGEPDGCHPNKSAYERYYVPQVIELLNKNLKY